MTATLVAAIVSCCVSVVLGGILTWVAAKAKRMFAREKALADGVQTLLRNQLIEYHDKYMERGYCPIYAKEAARKCYEAYHELGGNGVITKLYNDIMALPEEKEGKDGQSDSVHKG